MIRLMLGLIRPAQGSVSLTGADGQCVPASAATRAAFSYVPQGNTVFAGTIADNLAHGASGGNGCGARLCARDRLRV